MCTCPNWNWSGMQVYRLRFVKVHEACMLMMPCMSILFRSSHIGCTTLLFGVHARHARTACPRNLGLAPVQLSIHNAHLSNSLVKSAADSTTPLTSACLLMALGHVRGQTDRCRSLKVRCSSTSAVPVRRHWVVRLSRLGASTIQVSPRLAKL